MNTQQAGRVKLQNKPSELIPKGHLDIVVVSPDNRLVKEFTAKNFVTWYGNQAIGQNILDPKPAYVIDKVYYGDGFVKDSIEITPKISELFRKRGETGIVNHVIQSILRPSVTMLFTIKVENNEVLLINELGLVTKSGGLFAYVTLEGDQVIQAEYGTKINITWSYQWK